VSTLSARVSYGDLVRIAALVALILVPLILSDFLTLVIGVKALWIGIAALSITFLAGYGGMVSLAQTAMYGVAGLTMANLYARHGVSDWNAVIIGILAAVVVGLIIGAVASRTEGIYFVMLTLAVGVFVNKLFEQEPKLSGHAGISDIVPPKIVGDPTNHQTRLYYSALILAVLLYLMVRYIVRTPFGIALQGVRDEPVRMRALGFNIGMYRTLAFALAAFIAAIAGILSVWFNTQISPASIDLTRANDILIVAVIGGLYRLEGAWIGAFIFAVLDNYVRDYTDRFNTVIGLVFLVIVLLSPGGIAGIAGSIGRRLRRRPAPTRTVLEHE
jgi:branched-chain amino acid transport system permease protein